MTLKNEGKTLFAIFKNEIHMGNAYGKDKNDAIISYLKKARFSINKKLICEYIVIKAIEKVHFFKSEYIILPNN